MAKDRENIRIYGDDDTGVWVAPKGTTGPTEAAILSGEFVAPAVEIGWLGDDGIDFDRGGDSTTFRAYQGGNIVRKKASAEDTFKFFALEETALTLGLMYPGMVTTAGTDPTVTKHTVGQPISDERAWIVPFVDGAYRKVAVIPSGEVTERGTVPHKFDELTAYEFTVSIYGNFDIYIVAPA